MFSLPTISRRKSREKSTAFLAPMTVSGKRTSETQAIAALGSPLTVNYSYDADGNRLTATYPDGTVLNYSYTNRNQLSGVSDNAGTVVGYIYDANGNRISKALANSTSTAYTYDADSRLLTLNHALASGSLNYAYTLNNVGDRTSRTEALGSGTTTDNYSYDAIDQVTGVGYGIINGGTATRNVGYNYDAVGNRMAVSDSVSGTTSYTTNNLNQYTNIASQVPIYDNNGNLTSLNGSSYTYDAQNRLLTASSGTTTETFAYDPQNRCVSRTLNGTTTYFLYDGWQLAEELNGFGTEQALYVSGANVDELLYKASSAGTVFYQHDALGNTTALTDANGNLIERYTYDVFGTPSIFDTNNNPLTASVYNNRFLFTGREWLSEVGLYDYRNRVYSADLGRFLQTDPMRFSAGDVNIYRYCGNDGVNFVDLYGLCNCYDKNGKPKQGLEIAKKCCANTAPVSSHAQNPYNYNDSYFFTSARLMFEYGGDNQWGQLVRGCLECMLKHGASMNAAHMYCYINSAKRSGMGNAIAGFLHAVRAANDINTIQNLNNNPFMLNGPLFKDPNWNH